MRKPHDFHVAAGVHMPIANVPDNYIVLRRGEFDLQHGQGAPALERAFKALMKKPYPRLTIYFHGGLVGLDSGESQAALLAQSFANEQSSSLFLIWETSIPEVIEQNLPAIFNEAIFQSLLRRVTQFVKGKVQKAVSGGATESKALTPLPLTPEDQIQQELNAAQIGNDLFTQIQLNQIRVDESLTPVETAQIETEIQHDTQLQIQLEQITKARKAPTVVAKGPSAGGSVITLMDPNVLDQIAPSKTDGKGLISFVALARKVVKVVAQIIRRFANGRGHGVYLTIIEEILREFYIGNAGKFIWNGIKAEVEGAFSSAGSGGSYLVNQIELLWNADVQPRVTLVGHSAGSIYISRLIKELDAVMPADFKVDVVLVAPACTFSVFADMLTKASARIARLRIFGMGESFEVKNAIAGPLYPASLLYFVSGVLEDEADTPILGMQRFYALPVYAAGFPDIAAVKAFALLNLPLAFAWSDVTQGLNANCDMHSHGGWNQDAPATLASVLYTIGPSGF
jgi:hypothetical protein